MTNQQLERNKMNHESSNESFVFDMNILLTYVIEQPKWIEVKALDGLSFTLHFNQNPNNEECFSYVLCISNSSELIAVSVVEIKEEDLAITNVLTEIIYMIINGDKCDRVLDNRPPTTLSANDLTFLAHEVGKAFYCLTTGNLCLKDLRFALVDGGLTYTYQLIAVHDEDRSEVEKAIGVDMVTPATEPPSNTASGVFNA